MSKFSEMNFGLPSRSLSPVVKQRVVVADTHHHVIHCIKGRDIVKYPFGMASEMSPQRSSAWYGHRLGEPVLICPSPQLQVAQPLHKHAVAADHVR